jgi:homoserine dehydrogenase
VSDLRITVLKFGGSVLRNEGDVLRAVHEVYRWIRQGHRLVAVVSAFEGRTDELLTESSRFGPDPDPHATALLVSTGELTSAATLGLALTRAGLSARVATPASISLRATGGPLDADAQSVDVEALKASLRQHHVLVVPGFIGVDETGDVVLLGRGGSDLTALFLAQQLGAERCRLIKDVDGLYERDPALPGPPPRRLSRVSWDYALALGGGIVQPKSIRFARQHALPFEVGTLNRLGATIVDSGPGWHCQAALGLTVENGTTGHDHTVKPQSGLDSATLESEFEATGVRTRNRRPLRVLLLGAGTVGLGVYRHLLNLPEFFDVTGVVCRETERPAREGVDPWLLSTDALGEIGRGADVVVELIGGTTDAATAVRAALDSGAHVVTANKALIAALGDELREAATAGGVTLKHSAAVGGVAPVLESLAALPPGEEVLHLEGVINGTTNFVLDRLAAGETFAQAVKAAQEAGIAEADPARDLEGRDAADKLVLIAREAFGVRLAPDAIWRTPLSAASAARQSLLPGQRLRHIARLSRTDRGITASVDLQAVDASHPLAQVPGPGNRVLICTTRGVRTVDGVGAGRWPTAESVIADLLDLARTGEQTAVHPIAIKEAEPALV